MINIIIKQHLTKVRAKLEKQFPIVVGMSEEILYQFFIGEITTRSITGQYVIYEKTIAFIRGSFKDVEIPVLDKLGFVRSHEIKH